MSKSVKSTVRAAKHQASMAKLVKVAARVEELQRGSITGVPTEAKKAKARAKAKGPKAGSAQANQSVKYSKAEARNVAKLASANRGQDIVAILNDGSTQLASKVQAAGIAVVVGANWDELKGRYEAHLAEEAKARSAKPKGPATLARGAETERESRLAAAASKKAAPKAAAAKAAPKAGKNKQPSNGADRSYTLGKTAITAKPDTWRYHMLTIITKNTSTVKAKAAHEKSGKFSGNKLDFNWSASQGYIKFAK